MKEYIEERALAVAGYIIESNATVRQAARQFGISKSTVHKDITERLMRVISVPKNGNPKGTRYQQIRAPYPRRYGNQGKI